MPNLYAGHWPSNVNKTAKYAVRHIDGQSRVTVLYDIGGGLKYLAVEAGHADIVEKVNAIKKIAYGENGVFYINEYQHLIVPVKTDNNTHCYFAGKVNADFEFEFENKTLTTKPIDANGNKMSHGDSWHGPRPGIRYVIAATKQDIYYETPALTDAEPQSVRKGAIQKTQLSQYHNISIVRDVIEPILKGKEGESGRFYVNEHRAIFAPTGGDNINYIYCGQVDLDLWFPEPKSVK